MPSELHVAGGAPVFGGPYQGGDRSDSVPGAGQSDHRHWLARRSEEVAEDQVSDAPSPVTTASNHSELQRSPE